VCPFTGVFLLKISVRVLPPSLRGRVRGRDYRLATDFPMTTLLEKPAEEQGPRPKG